MTAACIGADCNSPSGEIAYTYDEVGNRLSQTLSGSAGNSQTAYTYNSASELTNSTVTTPSGTTSTAFTYDPSGNLTQVGNNTFTYNLDHTMASATMGEKIQVVLPSAFRLDAGTISRPSWQCRLHIVRPR